MVILARFFGIGFPPFLGGPFSYIDKLGASHLASRLATFAEQNPAFTPAEALVTMAENKTCYR